MALFKSNGDPLQGTISPPTWYPDPSTQNVNMVAMDQAYLPPPETGGIHSNARRWG